MTLLSENLLLWFLLGSVAVVLLRVLARIGRLVLPIVAGMLVLTVAAGTVTSDVGRHRTRPACTGPPVSILYVYRADTPAIDAHIVAAQRRDPGWRVLCRSGLGVNEVGANRRASVCGGLRIPRDGESCDEYPFASTYEGGEYASFAIVPAVENSRQGGQLNAFYRAAGIRPGDRFGVVVV